MTYIKIVVRSMTRYGGTQKGRVANRTKIKKMSPYKKDLLEVAGVIAIPYFPKMPVGLTRSSSIKIT